MSDNAIGAAKAYNELRDRLTAAEFEELQGSLRTILRLTIGSVEGPTRVPCAANVTFMIEHGDLEPLTITIRTLD